MTWKQAFRWGVTSTALASVASICYVLIYQLAFYVDFSQVFGYTQIIGANALACLLMTTGYKLVIARKGGSAAGWLNILYGALSFVSIAGPLGYSLPLDVEAPEMFPGMVIPLHFFPLLSLLTVYPFFPPSQS